MKFSATYISYLLFCSLFSIPSFASSHQPHALTSLGAKPHYWVYLTGLNDTLSSAQELKNRAILDQIGTKQHIAFLAVHPHFRCKAFQQKLCWYAPNEHEDVVSTYHMISHVVKDYQVEGYIGFSNGAIYLSQLVQQYNLDKPVVMIAAAGAKTTAIKNNGPLVLIVGKQDPAHLKGVLDFAKQLSKNKFRLIEHNGGHEIPKKELSTTLHNLSDHSNLS
jgi:predicted esterase